MAAAISFTEVCLFGFVLYLGFYLLKKKRDPRYPPGPPYLPIIGNLLQLGSETQKVFVQWHEKYGSVFSFKMGTEDVIMLNDAKTIKDVFAEASSAGRSPNPILVAFSSGNYGIVIGEGEHWEQQRRFSLRTLRDLGFAKTSMEGILLAEVDALCRFFERRVNQPLDIYRMFNAPVVNVLWNIVTGERYDWEGPEPPKIMRYANDLIDGLNRTTETGLMYAPALRHIAPDFFGWTQWIKGVYNINAVCKTAIAEHVQNLIPDSPNDLIDHYLIEMQATKDPKSSFYKENGDKNLNAIIPDLFIAGSETTSHTLSWLMVFLAEHQHVLKKVQAEIDNMIGPGRQPSISDRPNTPYTEATIYEVLRRASVVTNGIPHKMLQDAVINGHFFPKNATVISNIFRVHNDPKVWGDPENFRPERFLSQDGTKLLKNENLIPFSIGRRFCLGEPLARDTLYLFLACICQKFDIKSSSSEKSLETIRNVEPKNKMLNEPNSCDIIVSLRNK